MNYTMYNKFLSVIFTLIFVGQLSAVVRATKPVQKKSMPILLTVDVAVSEDQHARAYMEDRHIIDHARSLFGVFDGHSGHQVVDYVQQNFGDYYDNYACSLAQTFEALNADVKIKNMLNDGTTAVVAHLEGAQIVVANTGDSRAILIRGNQVVQSTVDHKPGLPAEKKRIEDAGGSVYVYGVPRVGGIAISRTLGDWGVKDGLFGAGLIATPDLYTWNVRQGDLLVLATDGIWDVLSNEEVAHLIAVVFAGSASIDATALKNGANKLLESAKLKRSQDNLTAMIVRI